MASTIRRLEQMLRVWEDTFFIFWASAKAMLGLGLEPPVPLAGPLVHAPEFRGYLLDRTGGEFDTTRFIGPPEVYRLLQVTAGSPLTLLPQFLWGWNRNSRRVFHVSADLQVLLGHTTLKEFNGQMFIGRSIPLLSRSKHQSLTPAAMLMTACCSAKSEIS